MNGKNSILTIFLIIIAVIIIAFAISYFGKKNIIGDTQVLNEINHLLLPVSYQNITEEDFDHLKELVKDNEVAAEELKELTTLAKYKEYNHIGHGLGFLYQYVKTGQEPACPGHLLSHYYVFTKHSESELAEENLEEAKEQIPEWQEKMKSKNSTYLEETNYTQYKELFQLTIENINFNRNITEEEIAILSNALCA